jgi:diacylglycerol kinase family enzyme
MYVYLYDNFLKQKKYDGLVKEIETRLTDYGIAGKIIRLQHYTNANIIIEEEIKRGAKTVVIVGNDATFGHVLSRAATSNVVFGFLPIGPDNSIAEVLGIPVGADSCDILSRRRKVRLDVGWFNSRYFVSRLNIPPSNISIQYDEQFRVSATRGKMELVVCNLQPYFWKGGGRRGKDVVVHPQDGKLEAFVRPVVGKAIIRNIYEDPSIFPFEEMVVTGKKPFVVEADGKTSKETKITIKLAKNRIQMIVGKERKF